jgi:hypothetical protein
MEDAASTKLRQCVAVGYLAEQLQGVVERRGSGVGGYSAQVEYQVYVLRGEPNFGQQARHRIRRAPPHEVEVGHSQGRAAESRAHQTGRGPHGRDCGGRGGKPHDRDGVHASVSGGFNDVQKRVTDRVRGVPQERCIDQHRPCLGPGSRQRDSHAPHPRFRFQDGLGGLEGGHVQHGRERVAHGTAGLRKCVQLGGLGLQDGEVADRHRWISHGMRVPRVPIPNINRMRVDAT